VPYADLPAAGLERHRNALWVKDARDDALDDQHFIKIDAGVVSVVVEAERKRHDRCRGGVCAIDRYGQCRERDRSGDGFPHIFLLILFRDQKREPHCPSSRPRDATVVYKQGEAYFPAHEAAGV
jgi:hypothetical protein